MFNTLKKQIEQLSKERDNVKDMYRRTKPKEDDASVLTNVLSERNETFVQKENLIDATEELKRMNNYYQNCYEEAYALIADLKVRAGNIHKEIFGFDSEYVESSRSYSSATASTADIEDAQGEVGGCADTPICTARSLSHPYSAQYRKMAPVSIFKPSEETQKYVTQDFPVGDIPDEMFGDVIECFGDMALGNDSPVSSATSSTEEEIWKSQRAVGGSDSKPIYTARANILPYPYSTQLYQDVALGSDSPVSSASTEEIWESQGAVGGKDSTPICTARANTLPYPYCELLSQGRPFDEIDCGTPSLSVKPLKSSKKHKKIAPKGSSEANVFDEALCDIYEVLGDTALGSDSPVSSAIVSTAKIGELQGAVGGSDSTPICTARASTVPYPFSTLLYQGRPFDEMDCETPSSSAKPPKKHEKNAPKGSSEANISDE